jgi:hypothetical protein
MIIQLGGAHKKMKVHKGVLEYTITEDDVEIVIENVQDHVEEAGDKVDMQRDKILQ